MKKLWLVPFVTLVASPVFAQSTITGSGTANYLPIFTDSTTIGNSILYQSSSNIGIGTTSPATALQVSRTPASSTNPLADFNNNGSNSHSSVVRVEDTGTGGLKIDLGAGTGGTGLNTSGALAFHTGSNMDIDNPTGLAMGITSAGNIGIGTITPITSLDLSTKTDALAMPVGTTGARPTGGALTAGEIRYNSSTPGVEAYVSGAWITLGPSGVLPALTNDTIGGISTNIWT